MSQVRLELRVLDALAPAGGTFGEGGEDPLSCKEAPDLQLVRFGPRENLPISGKTENRAFQVMPVASVKNLVGGQLGKNHKINTKSCSQKTASETGLRKARKKKKMREVCDEVLLKVL